MFDIKRDYNGGFNINNLDINLEPMMFRDKYSFVRDGKTYFFKLGKFSDDEIYKELLAEEIAKLLGVPHATYDIGNYYGRLGSLSESVGNGYDNFTNLFDFILEEYQTKTWPYELNNVVDMEQLLLKRYCLDNLDEELNKFIRYFMFDIAIGNSDGNISNIGFVEKNGVLSLSKKFDDAEMCSNRAIKNHEYATGLIHSDTMLRGEKNPKDMILRLNDYSLYKDILVGYLYKLNDKEIYNAFRRVEQKIGSFFPFNLEIELSDKLKYNRDTILGMLDNPKTLTRG